MKKNPFQYGKLVHNPENFFGREEEIISIYHQILNLHSVSLIGERKIGKTSLFLHLVHPKTIAKYDILPGNILMFYLDISSCSLYEPSDLFRRLLECLSGKIKEKIEDKVDILLKKERIRFQEFEQIIARISDSDQKIVFFLDEFESISRMKQGDIFFKLRYLAQMYDLAFVISTLSDLMSLFKEGRFPSSPFFNIFTKYQLRGLDENASRELLTVTFKREGFEVDLSTVDSIIRFSGPSPFFLKFTGYYYYEKLVNGSSSFDDTLKNTIQQELEFYHKYNWEHLQRDEQAALLDIIKDGKTDDPYAEHSLERKGYIAKGKIGSHITSESFHRFLRNVLDSRSRTLAAFETQIVQVGDRDNLRESDKTAIREAVSKIVELELYPEGLRAPLFEIIGYLELELRRFNKNILETGLGANWFKGTLNKKTREEIERRISKAEKSIGNFEYPENPFDYAILENLRDIILRRDNWDLYFSRYFEDKQVFEVKMQEIIDVRNRIAHYRSIHFNEAVTVMQNIFWMLTHMRKRFCSTSNQHLKEGLDA